MILMITLKKNRTIIAPNTRFHSQRMKLNVTLHKQFSLTSINTNVHYNLSTKFTIKKQWHTFICKHFYKVTGSLQYYTDETYYTGSKGFTPYNI